MGAVTPIITLRTWAYSLMVLASSGALWIAEFHLLYGIPLSEYPRVETIYTASAVVFFFLALIEFTVSNVQREDV